MDLTTKTEKITFGEKRILGIFKKKITFNVVADLPDNLLEKYAEITKFENENDVENQKKAFALMKEIIIGILSNGNKKSKVVKFVNGLGIKNTNKIFVFLNEFINSVDAEKKNI